MLLVTPAQKNTRDLSRRFWLVVVQRHQKYVRTLPMKSWGRTRPKKMTMLRATVLLEARTLELEVQRWLEVKTRR